MHQHGAAAPLVIAYAPRERTRAWVKSVAGKRLGRLALVRTVREFSDIFRNELVDAALVDIGAVDGSEQAAAFALEYPSVAFLGITSFRAADGPAVARCAELDFADVLVEGVDEGAVRDLVARHGYSARFAAALDSPPAPLSLTSALHLAAWRFMVASGGRPIRTSALASALGLTREHLSRSFGSGGTPTLKRLIDLVRLLSATELAKNPGYDVADIARVLKFSSSAHLSLTVQRLIGRRASSLAAMRGVDVIERFIKEQMTTGTPTPRNREASANRAPGGRR
jgi:AraC-like DNA-binding protein